MFKFEKQSVTVKARHFCLAVMLLLPMMVARVQAKDTQSLPEEPMESSWDSLPLDPNLTVQPVFKSHEGDIIIRGRKVGDHNMVNLSETECKQRQGKAIVVTAVGVMPDDICKFVHPLKAGHSTISIPTSGKANYLWGDHQGWVVIEFQQKISGGNTFLSGIPEYDPGKEGVWYMTATGALVLVEKGHRVVYAPGEEIQIDKVRKFTVKTVMTERDLLDLQTAAMSSDMDKLGKTLDDMHKKEKPHKALWAEIVAGLIVFGIPLAVLYGLYRLIRWLLARRRAKQGGNTEEH